MKIWKIVSLMILIGMGMSYCKPQPEPAMPGQAGKTLAAGKPKIVAGKMGSAEDLSITPDEISKAQAGLGKSFVGIVPCTLKTEYHYAVAASARKTLESYGLKAQMVDPEMKSEAQISAIENYTSAGSKVIVICVLDPKVLQLALQEAADQGVYIVQYAGRESAFNGISISIEDADLGRAAGEFAAKLIREEMAGKATVAILDYPDMPNVVIRANEIEKALHQLAPNAKIIGRYLGATQDNGLKSMENALQAHPEINVVVSINDAGAYGALLAMEQAKKNPNQNIIIGIDAEMKALESIRQGGMYRGTVDTQPSKTGEMVANGVVKILSGSIVPRDLKVPVRVLTRNDLK